MSGAGVCYYSAARRDVRMQGCVGWGSDGPIFKVHPYIWYSRVAQHFFTQCLGIVKLDRFPCSAQVLSASSMIFQNTVPKM